MQQWKEYILPVVVLSSLIFVGALCTRAGDDGGVWRSDDSGTTWAPKVFVEQVKRRTVTIARTDANTLTIDPTNPSRLYLTTRNNGSYVSDNAGDQWRTFVTNKGPVDGILVSGHDARMIFVVRGRELHRTEDAGQSWKTVFTTPREEVTITSASLGVSDTKVLYLGLSDGDVMRSTTRGEAWKRVTGRGNRIVRVLVNRNDARLVYVVTERKGLWKSADAGKTWISTHDQFEKYPEADNGLFIVDDPTVFDGVLYGSKYGLLRSRDGGQTWAAVATLTAPGTFTGVTLAVNPRDGNMMMYAAPGSLYSTTDGGKSWKSLTIPTKRTARAIVFHPFTPSTVYLGVAQE